jgi:hypothetical protein
VRNVTYLTSFLLLFTVQVVDKPLPWNGGLVGVNSFGFGGANAHIILRSNPKPKAPAIQDNIPRLVTVSGRNEEAVNYFLEKVRIITYIDYKFNSCSIFAIA